MSTITAEIGSETAARRGATCSSRGRLRRLILLGNESRRREMQRDSALETRRWAGISQRCSHGSTRVRRGGPKAKGGGPCRAEGRRTKCGSLPSPEIDIVSGVGEFGSFGGRWEKRLIKGAVIVVVKWMASQFNAKIGK
ncbi:uncharacterized protein A4U43_C01F5390 [Asparagus officinalis]|uniref:Uncharacterized protein n=1 Tax=Asparagus officinalis TaxID=4686 RepID=A0A5P1FMJ2_ASPOF|nr:uncharacterized protein A4U43_C01F5390 [Asparagus officinalis]